VSGLRALGAGCDPAVVAAVDERLRWVAERENAVVLLAVESGSRAWGFPSPDSNCDCRFIYARARDDYLSLHAPRDVIEFPIEGILDVNGRDLAKALRLLLKGNAVVIEWPTSPFVYAGDEEFRRQGLALARQAAHPAAIARHYLHLGERQRRTYFADTRAVETKKLFYALRPALALRWLRLHPGAAVAPMHFSDTGGAERAAHRCRRNCGSTAGAQSRDTGARNQRAAEPYREPHRFGIFERARAVAKRAVAPRGVRSRRGQFLLPRLGPLVVRMERSAIREGRSRITQALDAG
jgi:predicted nucleotidyltransferase